MSRQYRELYELSLESYDPTERRGIARVDGRLVSVSAYRRPDAWPMYVAILLALILAGLVSGCGGFTRNVHGEWRPRDTVPLVRTGALTMVCDPLVVLVEDASMYAPVIEAIAVWDGVLGDIANGGVVSRFATTMIDREPRRSSAYTIGALRIRATDEALAREVHTKEGAGLGVAHLLLGDDDSHCVIAAEIRINAAYVTDPSRRDILQTTLRHELGHVLGLGHSVWESDLMYPKLDPWTGWHPMGPSDWERRTVQWLYR